MSVYIRCGHLSPQQMLYLAKAYWDAGGVGVLGFQHDGEAKTLDELAAEVRKLAKASRAARPNSPAASAPKPAAGNTRDPRYWLERIQDIKRRDAELERLEQATMWVDRAAHSHRVQWERSSLGAVERAVHRCKRGTR